MAKKAVTILIFLLLAIFSSVLSAYADTDDWRLVEEHPNPYHDGREYTRQHWTRFWVNETGTHKNYGDGSELIGQGYCSVFDLPGSLAYGYMAVTEKDTDIGLSDVRQKFLEAFDFHYDNAAKAYPCSPAWYNDPKNGYENAGLYMSDKSGCRYDVPITKTKGDSYTGHPDVGKATINNPACLRINNPPADVAGGYHGNKKWYWYAKKGDQYDEINLTKKAAAELYWDPSGKSTSADIIMSFPYGLHNIVYGFLL